MILRMNQEEPGHMMKPVSRFVTASLNNHGIEKPRPKTGLSLIC